MVVERGKDKERLAVIKQNNLVVGKSKEYKSLEHVPLGWWASYRMGLNFEEIVLYEGPAKLSSWG